MLQFRVSPRSEHAFTLVELLVVVVVIAILAAIGIPRYIDQRTEAHNTTALSDLRNLIVVEISMEAESGLTDDPDVIAAEGWQGSSGDIRVCAELLAGGEDVTLTAWHIDGAFQYSYTRSMSVIQANEVTLEQTCAAQVSLTAETIWPHP